MSKGVIVAGVGALLVLLIVFALRKDAELYDALPPRFEHASIAEANAAAWQWAGEHGGIVRGVLGTGSMSYKNYIPGAPEGADPRETIVAYYVLDQSVPFSAIQAGDLCRFVVEGATHNYLHQAADYTKGGWIMAGNANGAYDGLSKRMDARNYRGKATAVFVVIR